MIFDHHLSLLSPTPSSSTLAQPATPMCAPVSSAAIYGLYIRKPEKVPLEEETAVPGDQLCTDIEDNGRCWAVRPHPSNERGPPGYCHSLKDWDKEYPATGTT